MDDYSIVLAGHGSRDLDGVIELERLVDLVRRRAGGRRVTHGYLEFNTPTISDAVRQCVEGGAQRIVVVPMLLAAATHAKNDMPGELAVLRSQFPDTELHFASAMDLHPLLLRLCREHIIQAEAQSRKVIARNDTCLVVVGRGTTDPDANSDISKIARMLEEGMGFGASFVCYSGTARPLVMDGLKTAVKLGFQRLVVLPYMLFDGILVKRIYAAATAVAERHAGLEVLPAAYLGVHPDVADVFLERAREGVFGRGHMNCSLCKYRVQIVGCEDQLGAPQKPHHLLAKRMSGGSSALPEAPNEARLPYVPHPIESESFQLILSGRDWTGFAKETSYVLQRLVHTTGDFTVADDIFFSPGSVDIGVKALLRCRQVVTDVTMVASGLKRDLLEQLKINAWCGVHEPETKLLAESMSLTRSAAGIRRAWQRWGNDVIVAIGDAPTAVAETIFLVREHGWRPQLVIGLPVGFVGTEEAKAALRRLLQVPRITNTTTRGGSPWAATIVNALMIIAVNQLARI